ncbi:hypothetical protein HK44_020820 [Pseudomonas fluorescens HK44]|uniref:Uncharacterized protein n=1 Tax=Pseudomonas fluorescens HK44 TaxID=1042209 RepID=A0A010T061_PSEFL|nr:hypothetical protein [Pseudomonas fluorescens]EXF96298.1 hypothetical protein HK44_020820 [Pseudomonas fluorescens HK44]
MNDDEILKVMTASRSGATVHCVDFAFRSLRAAETQVWRIWNREIPPSQQDVEVTNKYYQDILIDIHFYFISLRNVYRYLAKSVDDPAFDAFRPELAELKDRWFSHYAKGREAFEHIDQRLPGQKHESQIVEIVDNNGGRRKIHYAFWPKKGLFAHSDGEWDITSATFDRISADVKSLLSRIVESCVVTDLPHP